MKKFSIKVLTLMLTAIMILSSSVAVFASDAAEDVVLAPNATKMTGHYFVNNASGDSSANITPHNMYDIVADDIVRQFSTDIYRTSNTRGAEPRFYLVDPTSTKTTPVALGEGKVDFSKYDYLRIAFNIFIGDTDDGLAFRMQRFNSDGTVNVDLDYYIGVGGSGFNAGTVTNGYRYVNKSLTAGKWHNVVMELGSSKSDVNIYIDNVLSDATVANKITEKNPTDDVITGFPEGTYGFGGSANTCVMIPKGKNSSTSTGECPLDIRLQNFTMTATNTAYTANADAAPLNAVVYEITDESTMVIKTNTSIARTVETAPHIADKTAVYHKVEAFKASSTAGSESGYRTLSAAGLVGGVDYTKYNNLRVQFSIYLNDSSNGVYFRARRATNGTTTYRNDNYIFNIGGADFNGATAGSGTPYIYTYKGLENGKWYNVVMEIGANSANTDVKYYVNGELVLDAADDSQMASDVYGFGGGNTNWAFVGMMADTGKNLDLYLADCMMIASNTNHNPEKVTVPVAEGEDTTVGFADGNVYALSEDVTIEELVPVKGDYIGFVELDGEKKLVAYNDVSKAIRYYGIICDGKLHAGDVEFIVNEVDSTTSVTADILNLTGETKNAKIIVAYYTTSDELISAKIESVDNIAPETVRTAVSTSSDEPEEGYDKIKIFVWADFNEMTPLTDDYEYVNN